jgi:hypothetical protein
MTGFWSSSTQTSSGYENMCSLILTESCSLHKHNFFDSLLRTMASVNQRPHLATCCPVLWTRRGNIVFINSLPSNQLHKDLVKIELVTGLVSLSIVRSPIINHRYRSLPDVPQALTSRSRSLRLDHRKSSAPTVLHIISGRQSEHTLRSQQTAANHCGPLRLHGLIRLTPNLCLPAPVPRVSFACTNQLHKDTAMMELVTSLVSLNADRPLITGYRYRSPVISHLPVLLTSPLSITTSGSHRFMRADGLFLISRRQPKIC